MWTGPGLCISICHGGAPGKVTCLLFFKQNAVETEIGGLSLSSYKTGAGLDNFYIGYSKLPSPLAIATSPLPALYLNSALI
jgi:hypothetical protein